MSTGGAWPAHRPGRPVRHPHRQGHHGHGNDLFVSADRRVEELHAAEAQPDPIDQLRAAVRRSWAQRFALDKLDARSASQFDRFRHERDLLRARLSHRPPDPSQETRPLADERRREQQHRDGALWRRSLAQQDLDKLGPVGRRTRPDKRREIEDRMARFDAEIATHDTKLATHDTKLAELDR